MSTTELHLSPGSPAVRRKAIAEARRAWALKPRSERDALQDQAARVAPLPVRRDRKFYTSLALHQAVLEHLRRDPDRVIAVGIAGVNRTRPNTRGSASQLVDEWEQMLLSNDLAALEQTLRGEDERSVEMRNVSPFAGVLDEDEHKSIRERVLQERRWER